MVWYGLYDVPTKKCLFFDVHAGGSTGFTFVCTPHFHLKLIFPSEKLNSGHLPTYIKRKKRTFFQDKSAGNHNCDVAEEYDRSENIRNHSVNHELFTLFDHELRNIRSHFTSASIEFISGDYVTRKV